jgi:hypothetical protein
VVEPRELGRAPRAQERAREDEVELLAGEPGAQVARGAHPGLREVDVRAAGVLAGLAPFRLAVADEDDAGAHGATGRRWGWVRGRPARSRR